ncbi:hypothetical protein KQX54_009496 [Cotesia glomerata]|uniref:Translation elongation factor EF1B beta/delta subunit guanine nucleotide exchange domain-containing protein n=1 Tax=Cotesia glomerata TaxID=32391 RepID=A0AAV7J1T3_COTGL|nr:hypothetical protein KQX54_009496 [Cotesia glomerata]
MAIGDLKTPKGLKNLDTFLAERSYVEGWQASQADVAVLEALGQAPTASNPHVLRWYTHISSHELAKLPGAKKIPSSLGQNWSQFAMESTNSQIMCVVEDDKVPVDLLTEMIQEFEDHVQSVDIAAFNKI